MEDVNLHDALANYIEEELRVISALLGGDHVVHHNRAEELDVLVRELEERDWRNGAGSVSEGNERPLPLQEFEVIVKPARGNQHTTYGMNAGRESYVSFPTPSYTTSTPAPLVISDTL